MTLHSPPPRLRDAWWLLAFGVVLGLAAGSLVYIPAWEGQREAARRLDACITDACQACRTGDRR